MKKVLVLLLCLIPFFGIWAGGKTANTPAASTGPVTIDLWIYPSINESGPPPPEWKVPGVLKERFNIDMRFTMMPSAANDWDTKIMATAAANDLPDVFEVRRAPWENLVKTGLLAPVDDLYALMPIRSKNHYTPESRAYTTMNGKSYALGTPGSFEKKEGMIIRGDWLEKLGLKMPVTTDDWLTVMRAFTNNDPDGNGRQDTWGVGGFIETNPQTLGLGHKFDYFFAAFGVAGTWNLTKADPGLNIRKPVFYDALAYFKQIVDENLIDPNWLTYNKDDYRAGWKQGRFGMQREDCSAYSSENNYAPFDANFPNGYWLVTTPPVGPKGHSAVGVSVPQYQLNCVSARAMNQGKGNAIASMLEWFSTEEGYYLAGWGEKNVNYVLDANGVPTDEGMADPSKFFTRPDIVTITQARRLVFYNGEVELMARYPDYMTPTSHRLMSTMQVIRDFAKLPWINNSGADTLTKPNADLERFYQQGLIEFVTGQRQLTPQNWAAWLAEFDRIGGLQWEKDGLAIAESSGYLQEGNVVF